MKRRKFIKICSGGLVLTGVTSSILTACTPYYYAQHESRGNTVVIPLSEFKINDSNQYREFILVNSSFSKYPISIIKHEDDYAAFLMQCTHKGCELNMTGKSFSCPCHGSEFSTDGTVLEGPATEPLLSFKTTTDKTNLYVEIN